MDCFSKHVKTLASLGLAHASIHRDGGRYNCHWRHGITGVRCVSAPTVAGYNIYSGTSAVGMTHKIHAGNVVGYTVPGVTDGASYYFAVTARTVRWRKPQEQNLHEGCELGVWYVQRLEGGPGVTIAASEAQPLPDLHNTDTYCRHVNNFWARDVVSGFSDRTFKQRTMSREARWATSLLKSSRRRCIQRAIRHNRVEPLGKSMSNGSCNVENQTIARRAAKKVLGAAFSVALILTAHESLADGRVFFDDFESGTTAKWSFPGTFNHASVVSIARDGKGARTGTKMLEGNWDGTVAWNDPRTYTYATLPTWSYNKEFLIRLWVRHDADVDHMFGSKALRLGQVGVNMFFMAADMPTWPTAPMFMTFETIDGVGGPTTYNGGAAGDGNWHKIEIYIKHNTVGQKDGIVRVWNDGVMRINATNIKSVSDGGNWFPLNLMSNWSSNGPAWAHDANNHVYWDDIEIFSDTGTGGTGLMSDASISGGAAPPPPVSLPAPKNLR